MPRGRRRRAEIIERDARAVELRRIGLTYAQIAEQLKISHQAATASVMRGLRELHHENADDLRELEMARLDDLTRVAQIILTRRHPLVSQGTLIFHPETGQMVLDPAPVLAAIDRLLKIQERRAKLTGLDAPTKLRAEVRNVDAIDAEIENLMAVLGSRGQTAPPSEAPRGIGSGSTPVEGNSAS